MAKAAVFTGVNEPLRSVSMSDSTKGYADFYISKRSDLGKVARLIGVVCWKSRRDIS